MTQEKLGLYYNMIFILPYTLLIKFYLKSHSWAKLMELLNLLVQQALCSKMLLNVQLKLIQDLLLFGHRL